MYKYERVYNFNVIDEIAKGIDVYLIDKSIADVSCANDLPSKEVAHAIKHDNNDNRFEFYKAVKVNE